MSSPERVAAEMIAISGLTDEQCRTVLAAIETARTLGFNDGYRKASREREAYAGEAKPQFSGDESPLPWTVSGDSPEHPPMIWDNRGDAIVSQMEDGRPYFEREVADFIVSKANGHTPSDELVKVLREAVQRLTSAGRELSIRDAGHRQSLHCTAPLPVKAWAELNDAIVQGEKVLAAAERFLKEHGGKQ